MLSTFVDVVYICFVGMGWWLILPSFYALKAHNQVVSEPACFRSKCCIIPDTIPVPRTGSQATPLRARSSAHVGAHLNTNHTHLLACRVRTCFRCSVTEREPYDTMSWKTAVSTKGYSFKQKLGQPESFGDSDLQAKLDSGDFRFMTGLEQVW